MPKPTKSARGFFQQAITDLAVWYLRQHNLGTFLEAVGLTLGAANEQLLRGLRMSDPYRCPPEAFAALSKDRKIRVYASEPNPSKRWRLAHWRQLRRSFGSHYGEMINIQPFFLGKNGKGPLPTIRIVHQSGTPSGGGSAIATWHTLAPDGTYTKITRQPSNWNWDGQTSKWSRWWCIVYLPIGYTSAIAWDSGPTWDTGGVILWDGVTAMAVADLIAGLKEAKAAHSRLAGLILTKYQPTDQIPSGGGPLVFDPNSNSITFTDGATSLPIGNWGSPVYLSGPNIGFNSRPGFASFVLDDNP